MGKSDNRPKVETGRSKPGSQSVNKKKGFNRKVKEGGKKIKPIERKNNRAAR